MKKGLTWFLGGMATMGFICFAFLVKVYSQIKGEAIKIKVKGRNNSVLFPGKKEKKDRKLFRKDKK